MAALIFGASSHCTRLLATQLLPDVTGSIFTFDIGPEEHADYGPFETTYVQTDYESHALDALVEDVINASGVRLCIIGHSTGGELIDHYARQVASDGLVHYPVNTIERAFKIDFLSTYVIMNALYRHTHPAGLKVVLFSSVAADAQFHLYSSAKRFVHGIPSTRRHRTDISHQVLKFVNVETNMTTGSSVYAELTDSLDPGKPRSQSAFWISSHDWQQFFVSRIRSNNDFFNVISYPSKISDLEVAKMDRMLMWRSQPFRVKCSVVGLILMKLSNMNVPAIASLMDENPEGISPFLQKAERCERSWAGVGLGLATVVGMVFATGEVLRRWGRGAC